jgi:hypothetical protein
LGTRQRITQVLKTSGIATKFQRMKVDMIDVRYIGQLSGHGSGLYVRVPQEIIEYYGLVAGDKVKVAILQRKRWTEVEEK